MSQVFQADDNEDWDATEYEPEPRPAPALASAAPIPMPAQAPAPARAHATAPTLALIAAAQPGAGGRFGGLPIPHRKDPMNFPGFIARSAMFRASSSHDAFGQPTRVQAAGCSLTLSGPRLGMRDKHVWETAIQVAKERAANIGDAFEIELRDFAKRMGSKNCGGRALASIWESLERLALARVEFEIAPSKDARSPCKGIGSLLATAFRSEGRIHLRLNPDFALPALLGNKQFLFDQARRAKLPTSLAQWAHDFFSTHKIAPEMDLFYLRGLCGYDGPERNFPGKLRGAMESLVEIAPELVASFEIDDADRCSDSWKLTVAFGAEMPSFRPAQPIPQPSGSGRGRPAL